MKNDEPASQKHNKKDLLTLLAKAEQTHQEDLVVTYLQSLVQLAPQALRFRAKLARALIRIGNLDQAEHIFQGLRRDFPEKPVGYMGMGDIYIKKHQLQKALAVFDEAEIQTASAHASKRKAKLLVQFNQYAEGIAVINNAIKQQENLVELYAHRAHLQLIAKKYREAVHTFEKLPSRLIETLDLKLLYIQALISNKQ